MASVPERFLPVEPLIRQLMKERFPDMSTHPGSAMYDTFVQPAAVLYQRFRDTARVIQRNQSLKNFNLMLPEELDRLASNFLVYRKAGTPATGTQRVYFTDLNSVSIEETAVFTDVNGNQFFPLTAVRLTIAELQSNFDAVSRQYYADVAIQSEGTGSQFKAPAGTVDTVSGVVGAVRTENLADLAGGDDEESNSELYSRILASLTNRELVKKDGIAATIQEAFPTVSNVRVAGYGDAEMTRDVISASASLDTLIPTSFCRKVNLPLDENGEVLWQNAAGDTITRPIGGFVGALVDVAGRDFSSLIVTLDGETTQRVAVQEGHTVRFLRDDDPDTLGNDYRVTRLETVPIEAGGTPVRVIRLDQALLETGDVTDDPTKNPYTILGPVYTDNFHVGGKVDVYIDSSADSERSVVISSLPPVDAAGDVAEIPMTEEVLDFQGNSIFENGIGFVSPVITITKIEQLDAVDDNVVVRELTPDTNFAVVRAAERSKFTQLDNDLLVIRGTEPLIDPLTNAATDLVVPMFIGQRLRITYVTNPDIDSVQTFVDSSSQRDVTKDIKVFPAELVNVSVEMTYTGTQTVANVQTIVQDYIDQLGFGATLSTSDLITVLSHFGVSQVQLPMTLRARRELGNGRIEILEDNNEITLNPSEIFRADTELRITQA